MCSQGGPPSDRSDRQLLRGRTAKVSNGDYEISREIGQNRSVVEQCAFENSCFVEKFRNLVTDDESPSDPV
jgi:hypothetical protein